MDTKVNNFVYDHILVRYGELSTKGKNRKDFIKKLLNNVKNALRAYEKLTYEKQHDRMYIMLNGEDHEAVGKDLAKVFGISSFSFAIKMEKDIDVIVENAFVIAKNANAKTFKIDTRRADKTFPMISDEVNRTVATKILKNLEYKVDVKNPELKISIEIRQDACYMMENRIYGSGGYPVGVGGKALVMLSGGIDSPVACYMAMKRGIAIECIHYASPPYTSQAALDKVIELASIVSGYQGHIRVHIVPFTDLQLAIYQNCDESYAITIMRRMMYRIAQKVAEKQNCLALVNGESIGQVASQTLESMQVINSVTNLPVIRPLACMDKIEIIDISRKIGTYETSIQPFEDCCTIFTPKNPVTKPTMHRSINLEKRFDYEKYIDECIEKMESFNVYPNMPKNEEEDDLF